MEQPIVLLESQAILDLAQAAHVDVPRGNRGVFGHGYVVAPGEDIGKEVSSDVEARHSFVKARAFAYHVSVAAIPELPLVLDQFVPVSQRSVNDLRDIWIFFGFGFGQGR
ncbi:MAG: hypothetical protein Q8Q12_08815 [bacterium]|nr:hypothetical protein [bacterium]